MRRKTLWKTISIKNHFTKIAVISGVGVRGFYRNKLGYHNEDNYMVKNLKLEYSLYMTFYIIIAFIAFWLLFDGIYSKFY